MSGHASPLIGFVLGALASAGLVAERVTGASDWVTGVATLGLVLAAGAALAGLRSTTRAGKPAVSFASAAACAIAALALVHVALALAPASLRAGLVERPAQLVNDVVATLSVLALVWSLTVRSLGARAAWVALVSIVVTSYRATASLWHLDTRPFPTLTVQHVVTTQVMLVATALLLFDVFGPLPE
jgi:hypothetical protein